MENKKNEYENSLVEIDNISKEIEKELKIKLDFDKIEKSESTLDIADYCFVFLFGFLGAFLSTRKSFEKYLAKIHAAASENGEECDKFQIMMGKLVHHKKDNIDLMINRNETSADIRFHRLLWGHDVLNVSKDNPFALMIEQKGSKIGGILQALRHLIADTMSKQGLPMPGSSSFDYLKDNQSVSNYIIDLTSNLSIEAFDNKAMAQEIYSHMFTIRAQDICGGALARALTEVYFKTRKINDNLKKAQILFMVYAIDFFVEALIGTTRQNGVPYINIPVGAMMMISFVKVNYIEFKEIKSISKQTDKLILQTDKLLDKYENHLKLIKKSNSFEDMFDEMEQSEKNIEMLIDFLGGN